MKVTCELASDGWMIKRGDLWKDKTSATSTDYFNLHLKPYVSFNDFKTSVFYYYKIIDNFKVNGMSNTKPDYRPCRAMWSDGIIANTVSIFNITTKYTNGKGPLQNYRYINYNLAVDEIDWIYRKKSNNVSELKSKIWNKWADENGTIGKAYGYQVGKKVYDSKLSDNKIDQMDYILESLILDPDNRRMLINLYDINELSEMALAPCAYEIYFMVKGPYLNMILNQRSGDFLVAAHPGGWNEFQYYILYKLIAALTGYSLGKFVHNTYNMHIYDRHSDIVLSTVKNKRNNFIKLPDPFNIKEEYMKQILDIRNKYSLGHDVNIVTSVAKLTEEERKAYAREIIDLFYKYEIGEWFYIKEFTEELKKCVPEIKNIPVAE